MPLTGCFLHESHQPSAISTQLRAFMLRCVRQDMWVIKKVLDITVSHIYRDSGISYNILKHKNVQARSSLKGNPVKIRNGPAAVIGDEHRIMSLRPTGCGKARLLERSESQKTCLNRMWLFIRHWINHYTWIKNGISRLAPMRWLGDFFLPIQFSTMVSCGQNHGAEQGWQLNLRRTTWKERDGLELYVLWWFAWWLPVLLPTAMVTDTMLKKR
jgi:hypothetical protein